MLQTSWMRLPLQLVFSGFPFLLQSPGFFSRKFQDLKSPEKSWKLKKRRRFIDVTGSDIPGGISTSHSCIIRVPTPPGKSWIFFFLKMPVESPGKSLWSWKVLEIKAYGHGKSWKNILESHAFF